MFYLDLFICVTIQVKKELKKKISYLEFFFKNINILKFLIFKINRDTNPFYSKKFRQYINYNKKKIKKIDSNISKSKKEILVESFINQSAYILSNGIISFYLKKIFKENISSIIREGDIKSEVIFRSFGVKKFFYYKNQSFLKKIIYSYKALKFLGKRDDIKSIINLKYKKVNLGLTAYDSYIRYVGNPTLKKINLEFITFISEALYACDYFENLIKKNNFCKLVQSETSFVPLSCLFQKSLQNKIEVFSRFGKEKFTVRKYNSLKQCFSERGRISQKLFDIINKNYKSKSLKVANKIQKQKLKLGSFGMDITMYKLKKNSLGKKKIEIIESKKNNNQKTIIVDKNYIRKLFNWKEKRISVLFLSYLIDGNFPFGYRNNFKDTYQWTSFILNKIKKIKNVNWIIKDHPIAKVYGQEPKVNFEKKINYLMNNFSHIKRWPRNFSNTSLLKVADVALTSSGTIGIEYPAYGVQTVFTEKSSYSNLNFMKMIKTKKNIIYKINNLNNVKKPSKKLINQCKQYLFIRESLLGVKSSLLPDYIASRNIIDDDFWVQCIKKISNYSLSKDPFFEMFSKQIFYNSRHTINYKVINFKKLKFNDLND